MRSALSLPVVVVVALVAAPLPAQETPTEKTAAADVIRRMNELERSLALPQLVARLTGARDARRDAVVARAKELMDKELLAMADDITRHPETGWKEERSVKILADYLTAHGFDVEPGVAGLKTAFVARYRRGTPGPNLGVIVEYDALRGTSRDFHGDQHSAQGPVGLAAAVAVAEFPHELQDARHGDRVRHPGRGARVARREDRHVQRRRVQGRGRPDPLPFVHCDTSARPRLRELLHEH